jgi:hypothetical protein
VSFAYLNRVVVQFKAQAAKDAEVAAVAVPAGTPVTPAGAGAGAGAVGAPSAGVSWHVSAFVPECECGAVLCRALCHHRVCSGTSSLGACVCVCGRGFGMPASPCQCACVLKPVGGPVTCGRAWCASGACERGGIAVHVSAVA